MSQGTISTTINVGGIAASAQLVREATGTVAHDVALPAALDGELTTRTDNDTGVITLAGGHGLQTGDEIDVYWEGGSRSGMSCTVNVNAVTVDGGAGDNLPALNAPVTVSKPTTIDTDVVGNLIVMGVAACDRKSTMRFLGAADALILKVELGANEFWSWVSEHSANPFADATLGKILASTGSTLGATGKIALMYYSAS